MRWAGAALTAGKQKGQQQMFQLVIGEAVYPLSASEVYNLVHDAKRLRVSNHGGFWIVTGKGYEIICPLGIGSTLWGNAGLPHRIGKTLV